MIYDVADINIIIFSEDKENAELLRESLKATALQVKSIRHVQSTRAVRTGMPRKKPSVIFFDTAIKDTRRTFDSLVAMNRAVPVIVLTDKKNIREGYAFLENGATDFFIKAKKYHPLLLEKSIRFSIESKITAESLRHSNERYELVSKATNDMVWDWDLLNNKVFRSADGWDKVFGKTEKNESVHADSWWDRVHPEDKKISNDILENILKDKSIRYFEIECRIRRNDNSYATVVDRGYVVRNEEGDVTRLIGATQDVSEKRATEKKLTEERRVRQDEITNAVITAQEQEREQLGKELHDNINQILATGKLYIEYALTNDEMRIELLNNAKKLIESAVGELRSLSKSLLPPSLGEVGLIMALNELIESIQPVNKFVISTNWGDLKENSLNEELKLTVFRIIQEQLNNISKHAFAKQVWISLKKEQRKLIVQVRDNGEGFDQKMNMNGVGLKNIFSRAQLHNGKAEILTEKGKGCRLIITFKLPKP